MKLYDPTVQGSATAAIRAPKLDALDGLTIGLLTNSKVNADVLLRETAALIHSRHACTVLEMASKDNASAPAPPATIAALAEQSDVLFTATGD